MVNKINMAVLILVFAIFATTNAAHASVVVVANRTAGSIEFIISNQGTNHSHKLATMAVKPIPIRGATELKVLLNGKNESFQLAPNSIYFFGEGEEGIGLGEIGFASSENKVEPTPDVDQGQVAVIPVRLFVDDEEPRAEKRWRSQLKSRFEAASRIMEEYAHVRFVIEEFGRWDSIDGVNDFEVIMTDFERKVDPRPARIAIGFSTQAIRSSGHLGATRLPLHSHILVREYGRSMSEPERVEVLVHELGHFLGAVHSPEPESCMRPLLADGKARLRGFKVGFDPVNTMLTYLVGENLRSEVPETFFKLSDITKSNIKTIYTELSRALPSDTSTQVVLRMSNLDKAPSETAVFRTPVAAQARVVLKRLVDEAESNIQRPRITAVTVDSEHQLYGDRLSSHYIRAAADAALEVPESLRAKAFLLALGIGLDRTRIVRDSAFMRGIWKMVETDQEHRFRDAVLGNPSMRGREDLVRHFAVSAALCGILGESIAETAGLRKERSDGKWSLSDHAANLAGIRFATMVKKNPELLADIAKNFRVSDYVPLCPESVPGVSTQELLRSSSIKDSVEYQAFRDLTIKEISRLPAYSPKE